MQQDLKPENGAQQISWVRSSLGALHLQLQGQNDVGHKTNRRENGKAHAERTVKQSHERSFGSFPVAHNLAFHFLTKTDLVHRHLTSNPILG